MPIIVCGAEGEWALFENTLNALGTDTKRRGSVFLEATESMFKAFTGTNDMWFHIRMAGRAWHTNAGVAGRSAVRISTPGGTDIVSLQSVQVNFQPSWYLRVRVANDAAGSGYTASAENFASVNDTFEDYDIRIRVTTVTNPDDTLTVNFYKNSQLRYTTVVTDAGGWTLPGELRCQTKEVGTTFEYDHTYFQDVIVSDSVPTVGMELAVLVPSAVGNYSAFNNDYTNIDDVGYDASTVISTSTPNDRESWIFATPGFTLGDKVIYGVVLDTVAQLDIAATIADFEPFLRITATDYAGAALGANAIAPDSYVTVYTQNPATTSPWIEADLAALEAGMRAL